MNATAKSSLLLAARNSLIIVVLIGAFFSGILYIAHTNLAPAAGAAAAPEHPRTEAARAHG